MTHPSGSSLPLNSASAIFFSLTFSSSFFRCRSTITLFRKLIWTPREQRSRQVKSILFGRPPPPNP